MKYVLDASIAIKWVLPEHDSPKALVLRDEFQNQIHELIAPEIFVAEVAHALTRAERRKLLLPGEAMNRLSRILLATPTLHSYLPLIPRAVELSSQIRIGVYDCLYVALAEREQCELVTADDKLVANLRGFPLMSLAAL